MLSPHVAFFDGVHLSAQGTLKRFGEFRRIDQKPVDPLMIGRVLPVGDPLQKTPRMLDAAGYLRRGEEEQLIGRKGQTRKTRLVAVFVDQFAISGVGDFDASAIGDVLR